MSSLVPTFVRVAVVLGALAVAGRATAGGDDDREQAREHFRKGQSHYALREFDTALVEFKEAFKLKPDPAFLFNIAQCQRFLGDVDGALWSYKQYLRSSPAAPNRSEVETRIADLEKRKAEPGHGGGTPPPAAPSAWAPGIANDLSRAPAPPAPPPVVIGGASSVSSPAMPSPVESATGAPFYTRWWFWAAVGVVVVASAGGALAATHDPTNVPSTPLGGQRAFP